MIKPVVFQEAINACQTALQTQGIVESLLRADGPVFKEPWQAQAFAMTLALHEKGLFTWMQWAETLGQEIKRAQAAGDPDQGDTYYKHWLSALERLSVTQTDITPRHLFERQAAWRDAAVRTPHGEPIELALKKDELNQR